MDVICTCTLIVIFKDAEIKVTLFPTHYNHDLGKSHKQHLKIPKAHKKEITNKLKDGVPRHRIVQDIRDEFLSIPEEAAEPKHFASSYNIYNIGRLIDDGIRLAPDDYSSVKKFVADHPDDFFYSKFQNEIDKNYPVRLFIFYL